MSKTHHSLERIAERVGITNVGAAMGFIANARKEGKPPEYFKNISFEFYNFLRSRESMGKKIRVYHGWVCVLNAGKHHNRTGTGLTTVYAVPEQYKPFLPKK